MNFKDFAGLNRDAQEAALFEEAIDARVRGAMLDLHTALPARIVSYDPDTETCSAQPCINRLFVDTGSNPVPVCTDVPVQRLGNDDWGLTLPIKAGDECLLVFAERDIDAWHQQGDLQDPLDPRTHSFSDGFALVGFRNQKKMFAAPVNNAAVELRSSDRLTMISLTEGRISLTVGETTLVLTPNLLTLVGNLVVNGTITHVP